MNTAPELGSSIIRQGSPKHDYQPQSSQHHHSNYINSPGNSHNIHDYSQYPPSLQQQHQQQQQQQHPQQDLTIDGIPNNFPHRRSRVSRTFKNPPQPHMCIKEKTIDGKEVFINVLSWTRIANPDNPDAPIPLYGGMKVGKMPPGSPRAPPLVYAVMASPEVLKKAGRKCPDTPERMNLVDLMCEFVEAMNPTLHLSRKPEILKDRDLSGELKDVWSAVQACRDKGRTDNGSAENNLVVYTEFGPESAPSYEHTPQQFPVHQLPLQQQQPQQQQQQQLQYPQYQDQRGSLPFEQLQPQQQPQPPSVPTYPLLPGSPTHEMQRSPTTARTQQHLPQQSAINNSSPVPEHQPQAKTLDIADGGASRNSKPLDCSNSNSSSNSSSNNNNNNNTSNSSNNSHCDNELVKETESLKLSSSGGKPNGLTLPTGGTAASSPTATSPVPQQTSPTIVPAVAPTAPAPATPVKEAKNSSGHNFFPMFRSSKSNAEKEKEKDAAGGHAAGTDQPGPGVPDGEKTPVKTNSKKSGLNFFRRNKSSSAAATEGTKKDTPAGKQATVSPPAAAVVPTTPPSTPSALTAAADGKLTLMDESLTNHGLHHHHHHNHHPHHHLHLVEATNGGDLIESSATIVAK